MSNRTNLILILVLSVTVSATTTSGFAANLEIEGDLSCVDNALLKVSEEMIGRNYTPRERELKLEAMRASPDRANVERALSKLSSLSESQAANYLLRLGWEDWLAKIAMGCIYHDEAWALF